MVSRRNVLKVVGTGLATGFTVSAGAFSGGGEARADDGNADLNAAADATLAQLRETVPGAAKLMKSAKAMLIFPEIIKGGLLVGAAAGKGVMREGAKTTGYYQSASVSYGLQAGVTTFGYVMMLMDQKSVDYVSETAGWEVGVGPVVTVADEGFARKLTTTTVGQGIVVFFVGQKGFFAGAGIEGTKITRL